MRGEPGVIPRRIALITHINTHTSIQRERGEKREGKGGKRTSHQRQYLKPNCIESACDPPRRTSTTTTMMMMMLRAMQLVAHRRVHRTIVSGYFCAPKPSFAKELLSLSLHARRAKDANCVRARDRSGISAENSIRIRILCYIQMQVLSIMDIY